MTLGSRCLPLIAAVVFGAAAVAAGHSEPLFFDDFSYTDEAALVAGGWTVRTRPGHPGIEGARWVSVQLVNGGPAGGRLLRMTARTDGTPAGTEQTQICHARKYLRGTYAARVRFSDQPAGGADGDPVIQTFYAVNPLRFAFDPEFSELDWEYLPNGGWGSEKTRLYAIAWQTVRVEPWQAYNQARESFASHAGWRTLVMQVGEAQSRWFVDGREVARHGGRNHPVAPMAISFNQWFSPTGLLPPSAVPRVWQQDVDWVLHAADRQLSPAQVEATVRAFRARGVAWHDSVRASSPPLPSTCDF